MRCPVVLSALILLLGLTPVWAIGLDEAWARADLRTQVITAALEAQEAEAARVRTDADPLALRLERTQAERRAELARARLEQARLAALGEITAAFTEVLEAERRAELARQALELREQALLIAEIRLERGAATELDLREAQSAAADARSNLQAAEEALRLAERNLAGLLRLEAPEPEPVADDALPPLPALDEVLAALERHPDMVELEGLVELAGLNVALLDPSFAPRFQIEDAERGLERALEGRAEVRRGAELRARGLYLQAENALETWRIRLEALETARERLRLQESRLEAGLIAEIELRQSALQLAQAELEALQAKHGYLGALLELQAGSMLPLWEDQGQAGNL